MLLVWKWELVLRISENVVLLFPWGILEAIAEQLLNSWHIGVKDFLSKCKRLFSNCIFPITFDSNELWSFARLDDIQSVLAPKASQYPVSKYKSLKVKMQIYLHCTIMPRGSKLQEIPQKRLLNILNKTKFWWWFHAMEFETCRVIHIE